MGSRYFTKCAGGTKKCRICEAREHIVVQIQVLKILEPTERSIVDRGKTISRLGAGLGAGAGTGEAFKTDLMGEG